VICHPVCEPGGPDCWTLFSPARAFWIVVGLLAGWLAGLVVKGGGYGCVGDIVVGVIGGLLGGFIASYFFHMGDPISGINLQSILIAFVGAVIFVIILRLVSGRRA
jgi:uncharacterized membrane protein YeaQ/YmgE (transglycosylase-associated protein family)